MTQQDRNTKALSLFDYVDLDDLPQSVRSLAEIIGKELAIALIEHFAGKNFIFIPLKKPRAGNPILQLIGEEAFSLLIDRFGGTYLHISPCKRALNYARIKFIEEVQKQNGHTESGLQPSNRDKGGIRQKIN